MKVKKTTKEIKSSVSLLSIIMIWISHTHHAFMNTVYFHYNHATSSNGNHSHNLNADIERMQYQMWFLWISSLSLRFNWFRLGDTTACCICIHMCFHIISFCIMKPKMDSFIIFIIKQILIWKKILIRLMYIFYIYTFPYFL